MYDTNPCSTINPKSSYGLTKGVKTVINKTMRDTCGERIDLTNYIARMEIRESASSPVIDTLLSTTNRITLSSDGQISLTWAPPQTSSYPSPSTLYGDLELVDSTGEVIYSFPFTFSISPQITQI